MRKLNLFALAPCIASLMLLSSCNENDSSGGSDLANNATITGKVFADLIQDTTQFLPGNIIIYEKVVVTPAIKLIATIEKKYLLDTITSTTPSHLQVGKIQYETYVNPDGTYTFTIDAFNKTVPVVINAVDFEYQKSYIKKWTSGKGSLPTMEQKRTRFYMTTVTVNVNRGMIRILDLKYNDQLLSAK